MVHGIQYTISEFPSPSCKLGKLVWKCIGKWLLLFKNIRRNAPINLKYHTGVNQPFRILIMSNYKNIDKIFIKYSWVMTKCQKMKRWALLVKYLPGTDFRAGNWIVMAKRTLYLIITLFIDIDHFLINNS